MNATQQSGVRQDSAAALAASAKLASRELARLSNEARNGALLAAAAAIESSKERILQANAEDCRIAEAAVREGTMSAALFARLRVSERGVAEMAARVREVVRLADPIGRILSAMELDDGLVLQKESCPLGVVGIVFESRPDVVPQVASLGLKSGNAIILKGGAEAARTNETLVAAWKQALSENSVPGNAVCLLQSRGDVMELLQLEKDVDLIVPRGSQQFVKYISEHSRIPVLGHGEGICHVYIDRLADLDKAAAITLDSKVQYPAACNSAETLLVHREIAARFLPFVAAQLNEAGVELRGCPESVAACGGAGVLPATEADWSTEYSDLILSIRVVPGLEAAIAHIHRYGSGHTEAIVTEDAAAAEKFLNEIDAAGVYHNASTRFADGYRYGLGSEVGISTNKLHARGPMGMEGLTTYRYKLRGTGQTVAPYAKGEKKFKHRRLR